MNTRSCLFFLCLLLPLLCVGTDPANAKKDITLEPFNFTGSYAFSWRGIPIGDIVLQINEKKDHYQLRSITRSQGIVKLFKEHHSDGSVSGKRIGTRYLPQNFEARYRSGSKHSHVILGFDDQHALIKETVDPPINHKARPKIPAQLKQQLFDPLSGLMVLRRNVHAAYASGKKTFSFDLFEGKRLMRLHGTLAEELNLKMPDGTRRPALRVTLRRTALGGFKNKELKKMKEGEPLVHLYFSRDTQMRPIKVAVDIFYGQLRGFLRKTCVTLKQCQK